MQMSYLYASDFRFKNFRKLSPQHAETIPKNVWEKSYDAYSLSLRVQTTINHILICFLPQYQRQRKCLFLFRAREERELKKALRHTLTRAAQLGWELVIFGCFVLSMRMQVILDSVFARPGSAPIWGGKKGEFRDWTIKWLTEAFWRHKKRHHVEKFRTLSQLFKGKQQQFSLEI